MSIPYYTAELICYESGFQVGIATPRSRVPSVTSPSTSIYYTNLTCPTNATSIVDCNATRTLNEACLSGEQEYFITCFNVSECEPGDVRLYNERPIGSNGVEGIAQSCYDGVWTTLCDDGTNSDDGIDVICQGLYYDVGEKVMYDPRVHGESALSVLYFNNFQCPDNAESLDDCTANFTANQSCYSQEYVISCFNVTAPEITQGPMNQSIPRGSSVNFTCSATGYPEASFTWYYGNTVLDDARVITVVTEPALYGSLIQQLSTLTVDSVTFSDEGTYTCNVTNRAGTAVASATLNVGVPVAITTGASDVTVLETSDATFTCIFEANPTPQYMWQFTDSTGTTVVLTNGDKYTILSSSGDNNSFNTTLTVTSTVFADRGTYRCSASNTVGIVYDDSDEAVLTIYVQPSISVMPSSLVVEVGGDAMLTCTVTGSYPASPVEWLKDSVLVSADDRININGEPELIGDSQLFNTISTLSITNIVTSDAGTYTCRTPDIPANNPILPSVMDSTDIIFGTVVAPSITQQPMNTMARLGTMVTISVTATGTPTPSYQWYKDGVLLTGQISPNLTIDEVVPSDRGYYQCTITNSGGTVTSNEVLLTIDDVRQYIANVTYVPEDASFATLLQLARGFIGTNITSTARIYNAMQVNTTTEYQLVFTVSLDLANDGQLIAEGVTEALDDIASQIRTMEGGDAFNFTAFVRFDGCLPESTTVQDGIEIMWPEVGIATTATMDCPCGVIKTGFTGTRLCSGTFGSIGMWERPNVTYCIFDQTTREICEVSNLPPDMQADQLESITSNTEDISADATVAVTGALESILESDESPSEEVADSVLGVVGNLINAGQEVISESGAAGRLANVVVDLGNSLDLSDGPVTISTPQVAIRAQAVQPGDAPTFGIATGSDGDFGDDPFATGEAPAATIQVPSALTRVEGVSRVTVASFTNNALFQDSDTTVGSTIIGLDAASMSGDIVVISGLVNPVNFSFTFNGNVDAALCSFYNSTTNEWSEEGCSVIGTEGNVVRCACDHLSVFAATMGEVVPPTTDAPTTDATVLYEPHPILFVGLIIAIILIVLAVILHLLSVDQRHSPEGRILITSHATLIALYIVFVFATIATYTGPVGFCGTFSGFFQYLSLAYFSWLEAEAFFYCLKLRYGIGGSFYTRHYYIIRSIISWGAALLNIIISVAVGHQLYAVENAFCRPQEGVFWYAHIIPIAIDMILVCAYHLYSLFVLFTFNLNTSEGKVRKESVLPHYIVSIILHVGFAIVWIFALTGTDLYVNGAASVGTQVIFAILAIIHAVAILVLTLFRANDIRTAFMKIVNRITGRSSGKYEFAGAGDTQPKANEAFGLDISGRGSREGSLKRKSVEANSEEQEPLNKPDEEERYVTKEAMTETPLNVEDDEKQKDPVVVENFGAESGDEDQEKKTDL